MNAEKLIPHSVINAANADIVHVIGSYIKLTKDGGEYTACCPFHDEKTPSFKVNPKKGMFHCFGCGTSGDAVAFVMERTGCTFVEAVERITGNLPTNCVDTRAKYDVQPPKWTALRHAPDDAPPPNFKHYKHGMPSAKWAYHDAQGRLVGYVCRFEIVNEDGSKSKETIPITWAKATDGGGELWRWLSFATPRPLCGLPDLIGKPSAKVLVVEGEKTREAAASLFPQFAVVSWPGGGKAVHKADWTPLAGRNVCYWPDFDWKKYKAPHALAGQLIPVAMQPGVAAMRQIHSIIGTQLTDARIVVPASDSPDGWDLADEPWRTDFVAADYARANIRLINEWLAEVDAQARAQALPANDNHSTATTTEVQKPRPMEVATVDVYSELYDTDSKGKPISTIENMAEILRRINTVVRYNVINKQIELLLPGASFSVDNMANASLAHVISWVNRFRMPTGHVSQYVLALGDMNPYNPVANWVLSKPWDGVVRLNDFFETIKETTPRKLRDGRILKHVLIMRWMISAVAAAFNPEGVSAHGVLVLQGDQYLGKTKWMKSLAPKSLNVIKDGVTLNPSDKDSVMQCVRNWIVELGELDATFRKSDIANLKSFITMDRDVLRRPYAPLESEFARRTVFFASVNPRQFLHDPTGNRRFWTIECSHIDHSHSLDMQQVWAEVYEELYKKGIGWMLEHEEMAALNEHNTEFTSSDPVHDMIDKMYHWDKPVELWRYQMTATEICNTAGMTKPNKADINSASGYVQSKYKVQTVTVRGTRKWLMPPKVSYEQYDPAFTN